MTSEERRKKQGEALNQKQAEGGSGREWRGEADAFQSSQRDGHGLVS